MFTKKAPTVSVISGENVWKHWGDVKSHEPPGWISFAGVLIVPPLTALKLPPQR